MGRKYTIQGVEVDAELTADGFIKAEFKVGDTEEMVRGSSFERIERQVKEIIGSHRRTGELKIDDTFIEGTSGRTVRVYGVHAGNGDYLVEASGRKTSFGRFKMNQLMLPTEANADLAARYLAACKVVEGLRMEISRSSLDLAYCRAGDIEAQVRRYREAVQKLRDKHIDNG